MEKSGKKEKVIEKFYYLRNYNIFNFDFLSKNEPASKKVGIAESPIIINQSLRMNRNSMENRL